MADTMTIDRALDYAAGRLVDAGIENARGEARLLVGHALAIPAGSVPLYPERALATDEWRRFDAALGARCSRRPMAHITGGREFWSLDFIVTEDTLDPRPDSETLVEAALDALPETDHACRVLDLGTGTGCLLLAVLSERPHAEGVGVDIDTGAAEVARRNAERLGMAVRARFRVGNWAEGVAGTFDLVLANPPYIRSADIAGLEPEVAAFEPRGALDGGADGLDCYRALAPDLPRLLGPGGVAVVEIGFGQAGSVIAILAKQGLEIEANKRDLSGTERCLVMRKHD